MWRLDEFIAKKANEEDGCTGRFWEGRFKSKGLMDEGALLASMVYVDLNPIRAHMAKGLDDSAWTSIQQRLREAADDMQNGSNSSDRTMLELVSQVQSEQNTPESPQQEVSKRWRGQSTEPMEQVSSVLEHQRKLPLESCPVLVPMDPEEHPDGLPLSLPQYLELLEWTGRALREDDRGTITSPPSELIEKCGLDPSRWLDSVERFGGLGGFVGHPNELRVRALRVNQRWLKGQGRRSSIAYRVEPTSFAKSVSEEEWDDLFDAA
jgi:putative transposase